MRGVDPITTSEEAAKKTDVRVPICTRLFIATDVPNFEMALFRAANIFNAKREREKMMRNRWYTGAFKFLQ